MVTGVILLAFIGVLIAWGIVRVRRRLGLPVGGGTWGTIIAVVMLAVLLMYAYSTSKG